MNEEARQQNSESTVQEWDHNQYLKRANVEEVRLSRGFLRCRPERWFPSFGNHWLLMQHGVGFEAKIVEVKPHISVPAGIENSFIGTINSEPIAVLFDELASQLIVDEILPGGEKESAEVLLEYLARRLLTTLSMSWSGGEGSIFTFERDLNYKDLVVAGAIKVIVSINSTQFNIWVALGEKLVEQFDGLWRRQLRSSNRLVSSPGAARVTLELVQLGVPSQMLSDYLNPGTVVDLELPVTENVSLRLNGRPWVNGRIMNVGGKLGCEILSSPATVGNSAEGTTKLSIEFGSFEINGDLVNEFSQPGAILTTDLEPSNQVGLFVNDEKMAIANLGVFEGRFAITVV